VIANVKRSQSCFPCGR